MLGGPVVGIVFTAAVIWFALLLVARRDADFDWPKMVMVTAVIVLFTVLAPLFLGLFLFENLKLSPESWWPLALVVSLLAQIGIFVMMLHKFLWVPLHKALAVWAIVQGVAVTKEVIVARLMGDPLAGAALHAVLGPQMNTSVHEPAPEPTPDMAAALRDLEHPGEAPAESEDESPVVSAPAAAPVAVAAKPAAKPAVKPAAPAVKSPAKTVVAPADKTAAAHVPATEDPDWIEARALLNFRGKAESGGHVMVFINNEVVQVGKTISVSYKGKQFTWTLVDIQGENPVWEPVRK